MTMLDAALISRSTADSPSYALRQALAERLASHRGARPSMRLATAAMRAETLPPEMTEAAPRPLVAASP
ncbi:hypothetical protein [Roseomonas sp. 18066]|uniref:hypothetical protein n=1 Tax=Roseomonas sp. 18066 TaxID=2681412 RepID=UPI00135C6FBE|nr:hypothetical protein [Roseomonas sp. 18066]